MRRLSHAHCGRDLIGEGSAITLLLIYNYCSGESRDEPQVDTMSLAEADRFMRSPVFAANPIGIDVDFDQLVQRHAAGEPDETLLAYPAPAAP